MAKEDQKSKKEVIYIIGLRYKNLGTYTRDTFIVVPKTEKIQLS